LRWLCRTSERRKSFPVSSVSVLTIVRGTISSFPRTVIVPTVARLPGVTAIVTSARRRAVSTTTVVSTIASG
jgi:hypothetical protein